MCQQEFSGRALVVQSTMDEEEEISAKLKNEHNENDLGIEFVSFKWTSAKGIVNSTSMNCHNKEELRFEVLKGISINDEVEYESELVSTKETLENAEVNQRKVFVGIEKRTGKIKHNVLSVMCRGMMAQGKEWIRNNYGTTCLFIDEKSCKSSAMSHK